MNISRITRRHVLRGVGGVAVALPMLDIMQASAVADRPAAPTRFVSVFQPNGVYPKAWDVEGVGTDYALSPILEPLQDLRDDLLIVSHLDNASAGNHVQMTSAFLAGAGVEGATCSVSLDQHIANIIGTTTRMPSVVLGTEPPRQGGAGNLPISNANG